MCVYTRNPYNERQNEVAYSSASGLPVEKITQSVEHQKKVLFFYGTYCVRRHGVWHGAAPRTKKKSLSLFRGFRYILFVCPASTLYTSIILIICFKLVRYSSRHSSLFGV